MAGDNIQSKSLEEYIQEAREHTSGEFLKSHEDSYFLVGNISIAGSDDNKKLVYATVTDVDVRGFNKKSHGPFVYEITFDRISSGLPVWVGRAGNCTIQIEHSSISKLHGYLKLDIKEKKIVYADVGSKYGSKIASLGFKLDDIPALAPQTEYTLKSGQTLCFGKAPPFKFHSLPDFRDMLESLK